jgi:hypothetical protein
MERRKSEYRRSSDSEIAELRQQIQRDHDTLLMIAGKLEGHQLECAQRYDSVKVALVELKRSQAWAIGVLLVGMAGLIVRTYFNV